MPVIRATKLAAPFCGIDDELIAGPKMSVADWMPHDDGLRVLRLGKSANAARLSLAYIKKKSQSQSCELRRVPRAALTCAGR